MKTFYLLLCGIAFFLFSSFAPSEACSYAGSNMNFVQTQTEAALLTTDLNKARFHSYKAIKAIQKSSSRFSDCGCKDADVSVSETLTNLKAAVKATSINGARILLNEALQHIIDAVDALEQHEMHDNAFSSKEFAMNTSVEVEKGMEIKAVEKTDLQQRIDISLLKYQESLKTVVDSVNCSEARAFANKVFLQCEQQLLKPDLSEGKKYYNLRTKEITAEALKRLGNCDDSGAK